MEKIARPLATAHTVHRAITRRAFALALPVLLAARAPFRALKVVADRIALR